MPPATDCPTWCRIDHTKKIMAHVCCTGENVDCIVGSSMAVELTRFERADLVVISVFHEPEGGGPFATLAISEATALRDAIDKAVSLAAAG